jgi:peptide chain release factor 1
MWQRFDTAVQRFEELERQLSDPAVISSRERYTQAAKEHGTLAKLVQPFREYRKLSADIAQAETGLAAEADPAMRSYFEEELAGLRAKQKVLHSRLEDLLLVEPGENYSSVILEIRAGVGGDEAALFAGDLYDMYTHFARDMGWKVETISFSPGEHGGYKEIVFSVSGEDAYPNLRYESGGHRVQRVPETEQQGRVHTSAATVAVLPEPDEVQVEIRPEDITREVMRAGGAGGQHVNKTESAVRLWYRKDTPDEVEVKCQDERSQHKNQERAMRILRSRVYERQRRKLHEERAEARHRMIGTGDRSDRIRTYNFPQNRLTDHRINLTLYRLDAIIAGEMKEVLQALKEHDKKQRLQ